MSSKVDVGDQMTEKELAKLEKRIADVYKEARDDLQDEVNAYFADLEKRAKKKLAQLEAGEITEAEYTRWLTTQVGRGKRYEALRDKMAERYTKANETAAAYINDKTAGIYSLNRNYAAYEIDTATGGKMSAESFVIYDEQTVKRLIVEQPDLMPYYPESRAVQRGIDLAYGKQQITANITSGVLTGKSIPHIADDLQTYITDMSRESAVRAARTSFTAAQNGGRQASYQAAADMGIKVRKRWVCTKDRRTRTEHGQADGQIVDYDKCFTVGGEQLMYPGDKQHGAHGWNLYNCRCTMRAGTDADFEAETRQTRVLDVKTGEYVLVDEMTYSEWEDWQQNRLFGGIIGKSTSNGIEITKGSWHAWDQSQERGVTIPGMVDAITNPLHIDDIKVDSDGKRSQRFIGNDATVNVNPDTGVIITVWGTGKRFRKKYGGSK